MKAMTIETAGFLGEVQILLTDEVAARVADCLTEIESGSMNEIRVGLEEPVLWVDLKATGRDRATSLEAWLLLTPSGICVESFNPLSGLVRSVRVPSEWVVCRDCGYTLFATTPRAAVSVYDAAGESVDPGLIDAAFEAAEYLGGIGTQKFERAMRIIERCRVAMGRRKPFVRLDGFAYQDGNVVGFTDDDDQRILLRVA